MCNVYNCVNVSIINNWIVLTNLDNFAICDKLLSRNKPVYHSYNRHFRTNVIVLIFYVYIQLI